MTASLTKNFLPLCILAVLRNHADDGSVQNAEGKRFLTQTQIQRFVEADFDMPTQRRAIGKNLENLHDATQADPALGFSLEYLCRERHKAPKRGSRNGANEKQLVHTGWRLVIDDEFDTSEIRMLIDAVIASPAIPPHQVKQLIRRLSRLAPDRIVAPNIECEGRLPAMNKQIFHNIAVLNEAIARQKPVRFLRGTFGTDASIHRERFDGRVTETRVLPVQLLLSKGHYYLLGRIPGAETLFPGAENIARFRVDLLLDIEIMEKPSDEGFPSDDASSVQADAATIDIRRYRDQHALMMRGKVRSITLRVGKGGLHIVYDQFGPNVRFSNEQESTIDAEVHATFSSTLHWALEHYQAVEVISPPDLRSALEQAGADIAKKYG